MKTTKTIMLALIMSLIMMVGAAALTIDSATPADSTTNEDGDVTFNASVTTNSSANESLSTCTLNWIGGSPTGTTTTSMTLGGNTSCQVTVNNIPDQVYTWNITATSVGNSSFDTVDSIAARTLTVSTGSSGGARAAIIAGSTDKKDVNDALGGGSDSKNNLILLAALVGVVWLVSKNKK